MAEKTKKDSGNKIQEEPFESLIFPMKKGWMIKRPKIRARKSLIKRSIAAFNAGRSERDAVVDPTVR